MEVAKSPHLCGAQDMPSRDRLDHLTDVRQVSFQTRHNTVIVRRLARTGVCCSY
jgi:hypothetical protein